MRVAAILVLGLLLAGCGGGGTEPVAASWDGPQFPFPADGVLPVDDFRAYAESVDSTWERDPEGVARAFVRRGGEVSVSGSSVTLLRNALEDDSVAAERYVLELERNGKLWVVVSARREQRCHAGRGHQDFGPALCI